MAEQTTALAAMNGDYFSFTQGAPIGLMVRSGELLCTPLKARAVFGWGPQDAEVGQCNSSLSFTPEDGSQTKLDELNQPCGPNQIAIYTPAEGTATIAGPHVTVMLDMSNPTWAPSTLVVGAVESILPDGSQVKVPDGKALLMATGDKMPLLSSMHAGQKISIKLQTQGFDWEKVENVIGGGPILLKDGKVAVDAEQEGFPASFYAKRHPRTAIGKTAEGDIWLVTIDGRQEISAGATLDETAKGMQRLGCVDAINLDGGGSTCLHLLGVTVNRPSDGVERPVSNGILVFGPRMAGPSGTLKLIVPAKIALAGKTVATMTLDGAQIPNADIIWGAQGAIWIDQGGNIHPLELGKATLKGSAYGRVYSVELTVVEKVGRSRGGG